MIFQESKLKAARMHMFVRRGGPNYQRGLAKMRSLGEEIGIPIEVPISCPVPELYLNNCKNAMLNKAISQVIGSMKIVSFSLCLGLRP